MTARGRSSGWSIAPARRTVHRSAESRARALVGRCEVERVPTQPRAGSAAPVAPAAPTYAPPGLVQPAAYAPTAQAAYPAAPAQPYAAPLRPGLGPFGRKAESVGIVAGGLFVLGFLMLILGGAVAQLNFLLWLGIFAFFAAFLCGIVAVILAVVAAARRS